MFRAWMLLAALTFTSSGFSASFNCDQAKSKPEILICGVPELSKMDDELYVLYRKALQVSPTPEQFKRESRAAWAERERNCQDQQCLIDWFRSRKAAMQAIIGQDPVPQKANEPVQASASRGADSCRIDLQCWAARFKVDASADCQLIIQNQARYDYEWTDGMIKPMFSRIAWVDQNGGIIRYIGDELKLQNGIGNFVRHHYECDYDTGHKKVLSVSVEPGRLQVE